MPEFFRDGLRFYYFDDGQGLPFIFQHGLGGDYSQPTGVYRHKNDKRLISMDCRGHGKTTPLGDESKLTLRDFATDIIALMDFLGINKAVIGGISMGAAIALRCVVHYPERVLALVLSRPAWIDQPHPDNLTVYDEIAYLIREYGPRTGLARFITGDTYLHIKNASIDAANSLVGQFENPRSAETVAKLEYIPRSSPVDRSESLNAIHVPTIVLANRQDPIHPFDYGIELANRIPGAIFSELTPKSVSRERHIHDAQNAIDGFISSLKL